MLVPLLASFFSFYHVNIGGEVYISELILIAYLAGSAKYFALLREPVPRLLTQLGLCWLAAQVFSDIYQGTPPARFIRGWLSIAVFLLDFCSIYLIFRRFSSQIHIFLLAYAFGTIAGVYLQPSEYSDSEPWKFGIGLPITISALVLISFLDQVPKILKSAILVALGLLSIYLNARSLGGLTLLTATAIQFAGRSNLNSTEIRAPSMVFVAILLIATVASLTAVLFIYRWSAENNYLPENVTEKYRMGITNDFGLFGLILGGRPEILISARAVMDSPFVGYGSWAEDKTYAGMFFEISSQLGTEVTQDIIEYSLEHSYLIPAHSTLMQTWVWSGIVGAFFWIRVLLYLVARTISNVGSSVFLRPTMIFFGLTSIWNLLFSPFASSERMYWAIALAILTPTILIFNTTTVQADS